VRLGRATYTYTIDAASMLIEVEVALDVDPGADVSDVILTIGQDNVSHRLNNVHYRRIDAKTGERVASFAAVEPGRGAIPLDGAGYYALVQEEIAGFALGIHSRPREPARLRSINHVVLQPGRLHHVVACYRFDGPCRGVRLVAAEDKLLTSGGFYDRIDQYAALIDDAVANRHLQKNPCDLSISYDYGAEINAFAKCFAAAPLTGMPEALALQPELRELADRYLAHYFERFVAGHYEGKNTIMSRQLAYVILGVITLYRATEDPAYLDQIKRLCEVLLDFEVRYEDIVGEPASGFTYGIASERSAFVDGHSSSLLALTQALRYLDDPRFVAAIDRGLRAYCIETCRVHTEPPIKVDTVSTMLIHADGHRQTENAFWNFNVGVALRFFGALKASPHPALQAIAENHRDRIETLEMVLRLQAERSITVREHGIELGVIGRPNVETNSETQPWVMLGLVGHPCD
jgi:hypothetical protein